MSPALGLEPLEIAFGSPLEPLNSRPVRSWARSTPPSPRAVLEQKVLAALATGSVRVSFSGGRDSSLILAVACHVARREGLPLPGAVTLRHDSSSSQEDEWQELVVEHLGVRDWVRVDVGDSLDLLGETATTVLGQCGLLAPPNAYAHAGLLEAAPCDHLLTGIGGDEVLSPYGRRLPQVIWGRDRPRPKDAVRALLAASPRPVRRAWYRRRPVDAAWLTDEARDDVARRLADSEAAVRLRWDTDAGMWWRSRTTTLFRESLSRVAGVYDARAHSPLSEGDFVEAFAAVAGPAGPTSRTDAMRLLGSDLLPDAVLARSSKAVFDAVIWGPQFRAFAERWRPETLTKQVAELVDVERVRRDWLEDPSYGTATLAQQAWLDQEGQPAS